MTNQMRREQVRRTRHRRLLLPFVLKLVQLILSRQSKVTYTETSIHTHMRFGSLQKYLLQIISIKIILLVIFIT